MEFRDYLRMLRSGWPVVLLVTALGVGAAAAYVSLSPRTYQATSVVYVSVQDSRSVSEVQQGVQFSAAAAKTYAKIADSPVVLQPVSDRLRLGMTTGQMSDAIDVVLPEDTSLMQITASSSDPRRAADMANAVAAETTRTVTNLETSRTVLGSRSFVRLRQIQTAVVPQVAVSPNVQRTMALGLIVGLILGFAITIFAQSLDTRIRGPRALWRLTALPLIAAIPRVRRAEANSLLVRDDTRGTVGEAFRTLRTNIRFLGLADQNSLVVASVREATVGLNVAANLSWALAEVGERVVLVDADLRHPHVAEVMKVPSDVGLSDVLAGLTPLADALHPTTHPKLTVLPAGTLPPNPSELLGSPELGTIIASLEQQFDHVIIDAPAVLSYSDAAVIAVGARKILVTVTTGKTRSADLSAALGRLWNVGVEPLGIVLTQSRRGADPEEFIRPPEMLTGRSEPGPVATRAAGRSAHSVAS